MKWSKDKTTSGGKDLTIRVVKEAGLARSGRPRHIKKLK
jgi:hypothetical protein